jgi:regulator of replication initiation timing
VTAPGVDFNPNVPDDNETDTPEETEEQPPEETQGDEAAKLRKQLQRAQRESQNRRLEIAELKKKMAEGSPDTSETEKLRKELDDLKNKAALNESVTSLFEAGFNGTREQAIRMTKLLDDETTVDDLKTEFADRFGKPSRQGGARPFTGGGRDSGGAPNKDPNATHINEMLKRARQTA